MPPLKTHDVMLLSNPVANGGGWPMSMLHNPGLAIRQPCDAAEQLASHDLPFSTFISRCFLNAVHD